MGGKIFIFVGILLILTGVFVSQSNTRVSVNHRLITDEVESSNIKMYVGLGIGGLGLFFAIVGFIGLAKASKQQKRNLYIMKTGIDAQARVTFVDKNYALLVNKKPIFSIVEYTYQDKMGNQYTRKLNNINSDMVIRKQIQVGSTIAIKYATENHGESVMVLSL